jgi:hypothetical protein
VAAARARAAQARAARRSIGLAAGLLVRSRLRPENGFPGARPEMAACLLDKTFDAVDLLRSMADCPALPVPLPKVG